MKRKAKESSTLTSSAKKHASDHGSDSGSTTSPHKSSQGHEAKHMIDRDRHSCSNSHSHTKQKLPSYGLFDSVDTLSHSNVHKPPQETNQSPFTELAHFTLQEFVRHRCFGPFKWITVDKTEGVKSLVVEDASHEDDGRKTRSKRLADKMSKDMTKHTNGTNSEVQSVATDHESVVNTLSEEDENGSKRRMRTRSDKEVSMKSGVRTRSEGKRKNEDIDMDSKETSQTDKKKSRSKK